MTVKTAGEKRTRKTAHIVRAEGIVRPMTVMVVLVVALFTVCPSSLFAAEDKGTGVVAKVNGVEITETEFQRGLDSFVPPGLYHGTMATQKRDQFRKQALDLLVENELLYQEAKARGMKIETAVVDAAVEETKKKYKDRKAFERALKATGITLDEFREMVERNELIRKILRAEVVEKSNYTDKELEAYYAANKERFMRPEGFRVRHILINIPPTATDAEKAEIRKKGDDIFAKAKAGEDFGSLASTYSEDAYRIKGGDLGVVHKGMLEPAVEELALKMKPGEVGKTESIYGIHIIKLEEKKPAEQLGFADVQSSLRKDLESKRYAEQRAAFLKTLRDKAKIEVYLKIEQPEGTGQK
jgi:peptidyl-prolyl cis-trans isomerase C